MPRRRWATGHARSRWWCRSRPEAAWTPSAAPWRSGCRNGSSSPWWSRTASVPAAWSGSITSPRPRPTAARFCCSTFRPCSTSGCTRACRSTWSRISRRSRGSPPPLFLFANPSLPAADVNALIAYAKANPGKLSVGTPGIGSPHHLAAAMLNSGAKIDITHLPYRGTAPALNDLLGGQIPLIWATPNAVIQFVEAGKVKALATASPQSIALLPQVPTIAESALPGFDVGVWFGIAAPVKTPGEVVERLAKEIGEITKLPDVQKRLSPLGYDLDFAGSDALRDLIASDHKRYGAVIREAGIAPN